MVRPVAAMLAALCAGLAGPLGHAAPLETYGRLPALEDVRISPDGQRLAMVTTEGEARSVVVKPATGEGRVLKLEAGSLKLRDLDWAGPDHLIITCSVTGSLGPSVVSKRNEWFRGIDLNLVNRTLRPIAWRPPADVVFGPLMTRVASGRTVIYVKGLTFVADKGHEALLRVNLDAGVTTVAAVAMGDRADFAVDADGALVAQTDYEAASGAWGLYVDRAGQWTQVLSADAQFTAPELLGLGRDKGSIAVEFGTDKGDVIREQPIGGGDWRDLADVADSEQLFWDPKDARLAGVGDLEGETRVYRFFDPTAQKAWDTVAGLFAGEAIDLTSASADGRRFVVRADPPAAPPAYYLADASTATRTLIGEVYAGLSAADVSETRPTTFKASDGLGLSGYLTLPKDAQPTRLPLVVLVHGGPQERDRPGFDWWAQAMASRGYAVLQVNYRGSAGLGPALLSAGWGEMGRRMQTDLSDGVRHLADQGIIDPARVCIVGASYGGYAALAGAALQSGIYHCAVSVAGLSDLPRMLAWEKSRETKGVGASIERYWLRYMGDPAHLADISPALHAEKVTIPILLVHGKDDTVVDYEQSQIMADALTRAGKPFQFVTLPGEDHWLSRGATRQTMLAAVIAFLQKNNPSDQPAANR